MAAEVFGPRNTQRTQKVLIILVVFLFFCVVCVVCGQITCLTSVFICVHLWTVFEKFIFSLRPSRLAVNIEFRTGESSPDWLRNFA